MSAQFLRGMLPERVLREDDVAEDAKDVPTIVLKLTKPEVFNVELEIDLARLALMRVMLLEGVRTVDKLLQYQDALEFQVKMQNAAPADRAMRRPLIRQ